MNESKTLLGRIPLRQKMKIVSIDEKTFPEITQQLLDMGFVENEEVEVIHQAPISQDPIAVRIKGTIVALRRSEADLIEVQAL